MKIKKIKMKRKKTKNIKKIIIQIMRKNRK